MAVGSSFLSLGKLVGPSQCGVRNVLYSEAHLTQHKYTGVGGVGLTFSGEEFLEFK